MMSNILRSLLTLASFVLVVILTVPSPKKSLSTENNALQQAALPSEETLVLEKVFQDQQLDVLLENGELVQSDYVFNPNQQDTSTLKAALWRSQNI